MTSHVKELFVPVAGVHQLAWFYDQAVALLTRERTWHPRLVDQVAPRPNERILDLGCGTGTLTVKLQQACAEAEVIGLDMDRDALRIARAKANAAGCCISFWHGRADDRSSVPLLPFSNFDKIVSTLLFHHLTVAQKLRVLRRARNVLCAGGEMHIADWGKPANAVRRVLFCSVQAFDEYAHIEGSLPEFMREVGFSDVTETRREGTVFGTLCVYRGVKE